ncbi:Uncharacterised protein [Mycobacteroides abscessus subsp. massiliense]|nr:Uncharacterised protein [Mycobacteroides abscessus subsp. massiliense]
MNPYTVGRIDPRGLAMEVLTGRHQPPRDHLVAQDLLVSVDVGQIHLQGPDPLGDAPLQPGPFRGGDDARHQVQRKRTFLTRQREGDALIDERPAQGVGTRCQVGGVGGRELGIDALVRAAHVAVGIEHLVEGLGVGPLLGHQFAISAEYLIVAPG